MLCVAAAVALLSLLCVLLQSYMYCLFSFSVVLGCGGKLYPSTAVQLTVNLIIASI